MQRQAPTPSAPTSRPSGTFAVQLTPRAADSYGGGASLGRMTIEAITDGRHFYEVDYHLRSTA